MSNIKLEVMDLIISFMNDNENRMSKLLDRLEAIEVELEKLLEMREDVEQWK